MTFHTPYNRLRGGTVPMLNIRERATIERIVAKDALKFAFVVWLAMRLVLSAWGALVMATAPQVTYPNVVQHYPGVYVPGYDLHGFVLGLWNVHDTQNYISIAENGYASDPPFFTAFFPGYPLLIKVVGFILGGQSLLAALLITNISALFFFWYLYRLVEADYGQTIARRSLVISAVFPTSFFLFMGYTEAPLMAFAVAAFYYGRQHKWWLAGILAGCAALTKQPGVFLMLPLGYMYWRQYTAYKVKDRGVFLKKLQWAWLLLIPIAFLGYMAYSSFLVGDHAKGATELGAGEVFTPPGLPLIRAFLAINPDNLLLGPNLLDIGFTLLMIGLVVGVVLKMRANSFSLYSLPVAFISLCVTYSGTAYIRPEIDLPRRTLIIFPIFILLAITLPSARAFRYFVYLSMIVYLCLTGLFINWFFVS